MKTRHLTTAMLIIALAVIEFSYFKGVSLTRGGPPLGAATGVVAADGRGTEPPPPFDVKPLLRPAKKYFGVALDGNPTDPAAVRKFADLAGKAPNLITIYESFDDGFAAAQVREAYQQGAMAVIRWEPFKAKLADIASGKHDAYATKFATAVRTLNLPIVLTFAHEMNGNWYPWGNQKASPADFVAAWQHLHDLFAKAGATNVIWAWTANVINPVPSVKLQPLYPGDAYVDWLGIDGYYTRNGAHTYETLFQPTIRAMRKLSAKPFLIVETGAEPGSSRPSWVRDLITETADDADMLGFVYFDRNGSARWKIDSDTGTITALREAVKDPDIGFTVR